MRWVPKAQRRQEARRKKAAPQRGLLVPFDSKKLDERDDAKCGQNKPERPRISCGCRIQEQRNPDYGRGNPRSHMTWLASFAVAA